MNLARMYAAQRASWPVELAPIPADEWPTARPGAPYPIQALRSRDFLVQVFEEKSGLRMSVNRTEVRGWRDGRPLWKEGIGWDDLQRLKQEAGYGYIRVRPDLQQEPHGWRMPRAVRVDIRIVSGAPR